MNFRDFLLKIRGFSTPFVGLSWDISKTEKEIANEVLLFLEDRRALTGLRVNEFGGSAFTFNIEHCIKSILKVRDFLSEALNHVDIHSLVGKCMIELRYACRRFLNEIGPLPFASVGFGYREFNIALLKLCMETKRCIDELSSGYGLELPGELEKFFRWYK